MSWGATGRRRPRKRESQRKNVAKMSYERERGSAKDGSVRRQCDGSVGNTYDSQTTMFIKPFADAELDKI